jgi:hypothetical protein
VELTNPRLRFIVPEESVFAKGGHSHLVDAEASAKCHAAVRPSLFCVQASALVNIARVEP